MGAKFDIIIIGAGIAGLGASIALSDKGHKVTVLERHPQLQTNGGAIGVGPSATRVLHQYQVLESALERNGDLTKKVFQRRWKDGSVLMESTQESTKQAFGFDGCRGKRSDFQLLLFEASQKRGVSVRFNCMVTSVDQELPSVTLEDGRVLYADLIVAADGIKSATRMKFNSSKQQLFSGLDDHMFTVPIAKFEQDPRFHFMLNNLNFWLGEGGCVVAGPCDTDDGVQMFLEFVILGENKGKDGTWQKETDLDHVRRFFSNWDPLLSEILTFSNTAHIWRLAYTDPGAEWVSESGKVVLIGDAVHAVLPHTGAGATTGIEDGASLAECIERASSISDIPKSTGAFQAIRKPRLNFLQHEGISRAKSWHLPDGPEQQARDKMLHEISIMVASSSMSWNGIHIDDPPSKDRMDLRMPYVQGHKAVEYANRRLDELMKENVIF